jgi:PKD repeat protein
MNRNRLAMVLTWGFLGLVLAALWLLASADASRLALAQPPDGVIEPAVAGSISLVDILTVCPNGPPDCDFAVVQDAVDAAAEGDVIKIATGIYTGVEGRPVPAGYLNPPPSGVISQVVYISKTLTVRGGYTTTNDFADPPDPVAFPTTLDAEGQGRVLLAAGDISLTAEGLRITGGNATGLGGYSGVNWPDFDTGGGVFVIGATSTFSNNMVFGNTAGSYGSGGGMYLLNDDSTLINNTFTDNTANSLYGGGLYTLYSDSMLTGSTFSANTARWGGAVFLEFSPATLVGNDFSGNSCAMAGGALNVHTSDAMIAGNTLTDNQAFETGGAMRLYDSAANIMDNFIAGNTATGWGGGLHLWASPSILSGNTIWDNTATAPDSTGGALEFWLSDATLINNVIADNRAGTVGTALFVTWNSSPRLRHNTIARNAATSGGDGSAIYVDYYQGPSTVWLTDTILVSHTVGVTVTAGNAVILEATLWGDGVWANGTDWGGAGTIVTGTVNLWDVPAFVAPDEGDYHIDPSSAAVDTGVDAGVTWDLDGEPRPMGAGYDIGADEVPCVAIASVTFAPTETVLFEPTVFTPTVYPEDASPPISYTWDFGDGSPPVTDPAPVHAFECGPVTVTLTATNSCSQQTVAQAVSVIQPPCCVPPDAGFTYTQPIMVGEPISFTNVTTWCTFYPITYTWDFGDGTPPVAAVHPAHTFAAPGAYTVWLTASMYCGCDSWVSGVYSDTLQLTGPGVLIYLPLALKER